MKVAEIYKSVQGEGLLTGKPSVFVRASGCNLRCWFCDTQFASWEPEGSDYAVDEIVAEIEEWDCQHVVLTGGEPMLFAEIIPLAEALRLSGRHLTIETAGTLYLPVECDLMSISPKLTSSGPDLIQFPHWHRRHERQRFQPDVIVLLLEHYDYQIKFVIDHIAEIDEVDNFLSLFSNIRRDRVLLMPQGISQAELSARADWLEPICQQRGWTYCPRKQIEWFGPVRGT